MNPADSRGATVKRSSALVGGTDSRRPTLSVIIPAYNSSRTIERCVQSLATQETTHLFEIIVVHSGTDDTCGRALGRSPETRVVELGSRAVAARARNLGTAMARGEMFAFVDSDAYAEPGWVEHAVAAGRSGYDLVCGAVGNANPQCSVSRAEQLLMFNEFLPGARRAPSWFALSGNMVLPRAAYQRFGPFDERRAAEDVVFSRRLVAAGGRILFDPAFTILHDNRTKLRPFLRNQVLIGRHTAMARRLVPFADSKSYPLFLAVLPISPAVKLAKVAWHLVRQDRRHLRELARNFPLVTAGICAYCVGMTAGAVGPIDKESAVPAFGGKPVRLGCAGSIDG